MDLTALADAVRTTRRQRRMTQEELAEAANVSLGVVSNLERKLTRPQPANEAAILAALDIEQEEPREVEDDRHEWPLDVAVVLDVIGLRLTSIPEADRPAAIRDLTRWAMTYPFGQT